MTHRNHININQYNVSPRVSKDIYQVKPLVYPIILTIWGFIMVIFEYYTFKHGIIPTYQSNHPIYASLIAFNQIFVAIFFYFGITNFVFPLRYQYLKNKVKTHEEKLIQQPFKKGFHPKVQLLYTTYNDFMPYALEQCLQQTYDNVTGVILDNSTDKNTIKEIRQFVNVHPDVKWIRNPPNGHAKAGNLTQYLNNKPKPDYDYFVVLDADELIEPQFVEKCLKFFQADSHLGILQANHISGRNTNQFMSEFANAANSFWPVQNTVRSAEGGQYMRNDYGKSINTKTGNTMAIGLGHGMMVSKRCYQSIGQFPYVVAEDLTFSFEALLHGFNIKFASQIYGNEQFPIDMNALSVRSAKFCSANFQFFKLYGRKLFATKLLTWFQKLDLISFTLSVPIFAINYVSLILSSVVFPLANINPGNQSIMFIPTLLCYFSQSLSDAMFQVQSKQKPHQVISYLIQSILLYGNAYYLTVKCTFLAIINVPAKFNVTPKNATKITLRDTLRINWQGTVFSLITIMVCMSISGSSWILLSFFPGVIGWALAFKANHKSKYNQNIEIIIKHFNQEALKPKRYEVIDWRI